MSYISKIEPARQYKPKEVVDLELIPGIDKTFKLYNLMSYRVKNEDGTYTRKNYTELTDRSLPAIVVKNPFAKTAYRHYYLGKDIIEFLKLNNIE